MRDALEGIGECSRSQAAAPSGDRGSISHRSERPVVLSEEEAKTSSRSLARGAGSLWLRQTPRLGIRVTVIKRAPSLIALSIKESILRIESPSINSKQWLINALK